MKKTAGIVTEFNRYCVFCSRPTEEEHHLLFGRGTRKLAEKDGIKVPVCSYCHTQNPVAQRIHDNTMAEKLSKIAGQLAWEKRCVASGKTEEEARADFTKRYGRSYL